MHLNEQHNYKRAKKSDIFNITNQSPKFIFYHKKAEIEKYFLEVIKEGERKMNLH